MGLMILVGAQNNLVLAGLLLGALALTFWETREHRFPIRQTVWALLFVALLHVPGYLLLRGWLVYRKRGHAL